MTFKAFFSKYWITITLIFIVVISFLLRIWRLGKIGDQIFDEVYFVKFAENYLNGVSFFDIHPPLGKLIIAFGLKIFGDTSFTWRIMPAIFGTLLIILGYFTGKELSSKRVGIMVAGLLSLDGMLLVYSRTGLIDIFLVFFVLLSFLFFLKFINSNKTYWLIFTGIAVGMAASVKYVGALVLIVFLLIAIDKKMLNLKNIYKYFVFLILLPLTIYLSFFIFNFGYHHLFAQVYEWQMQSFNYNIGLKDSHPYGSKWWGWFLLLRPIWLYFKEANGSNIGIDGIGNPLIWWSSIIIVPLLIWGTARKYKNNLVVLIGFLVFLLFWAPFHRVLFFYHGLPSFMFLVLGISLWLERLITYIPLGKYLVVIYFILLLTLFIYFLPIWLGLPLNSDQFYHRIWLKGWI